MGMRVSSSGSSQVGAAGMWQQQRQAFAQLGQALQSGDLSAAKTAYASLTAKSTAAPNSSGALGKLGEALQSGDVSAAQQAFTALRSGARLPNQASAAQVPSSSSSASQSSSSAVGTLLNTTA
jgi:hypothetical protein